MTDSARLTRLVYFVLGATVVAADQITKLIVDRSMVVHESREVLTGLLSLTYIRNRGAAFGILSNADLPYQPVLFTCISLLALVAIVMYSHRLPAENRLPQSALALVTGGAVGNLIDRARLGYVIDYVDFYWGTHHWPAFNVADSAISVGVGLLVLDLVRTPHSEQISTASVPDPASSSGGN